MPSVVLRAEAYSLAGQWARAAEEWQAVLNNPGIVQLSATAPVAKLQIARAYRQHVRGDDRDRQAKARAAYHSFLSLWKEGDSDIPILKQAEQEFATLR